MPVRSRSTYPPLDTLKAVADGIWIVDSGPFRAMGLRIPVRMTVLRLKRGGVLLHSPTRFSESLGRELGHLGPIRHLIAPNIAHWTFLKEWQSRYPAAITWTVPGLPDRAQVKKSGVRIDRILSSEAPAEWSVEVEQTLIPGAAGFSEVAFFHTASRTLILTDLVVNVEPEKLPWVIRPFAHIAGVTAPAGKAPIYLRMVIKANQAEAAAAARRLIEMRPERVIFSHGSWFEADGTARLKRSLQWLL